MCAKIAVTDSGVGGLAVLKKLEKRFPFVDFVYVSDYKNFPYLNKSNAEVQLFCKNNLEIALNSGADILVVACNTMSQTGREVFERFSTVPTFFVEPDVEKIKRLGAENCILFCTQLTAISDTIAELNTYTANCVVPLKNLATDIEKNIFALKNFYPKELNENYANRPFIFLGCTHYLLIEDKFKKRFKNCTVFDGIEKIVTPINSLLLPSDKKQSKISKSFIGSGNLRAKEIYERVISV
ncbi:MAG: aspartate/glutamate racemase family protein [Clostridia bacterium]|nr:aspartate/glutamate racemase family protein [Clostridia bacterium]